MVMKGEKKPDKKYWDKGPALTLNKLALVLLTLWSTLRKQTGQQ